MSDLGKTLADKINGDFRANMAASERIKVLANKAAKGKATYKDANEYSLQAGEQLAKAYRSNVSSDILPDGYMDYDLAKEVLTPTTKANYDAVVEYGAAAQRKYNKDAGVSGLEPQRPDLDEDRVDGLADFISGNRYDDRARMFEQALVNLSQHHIDAMVRDNGRFLSDAGYRPKISREADGGACTWCLDRVGTYEYGDEPTDIYERHRDCRCITTLERGRRYENVWNKVEYDSVREARIAREEEILAAQERRAR